MLDVLALAQQCAPQIHPDTILRLVRAESNFNPFAIGVVGATLRRQPKSLTEAVDTVQWLEQNGYQYSVGLAQIFKGNFKKYGLTAHSAFDTCTNLRTSAVILTDCYQRALHNTPTPRTPQIALREAFSCYNSGNFAAGFINGYVASVTMINGKAVPRLRGLELTAYAVTNERSSAVHVNSSSSAIRF